MKTHRSSRPPLSFGLIFALALAGLPCLGQERAAAISGFVVSSPDSSSVAGALLHLTDPIRGTSFTSSPTSMEGQYALSDLPPSTYQVSVQTGRELYLVSAPLQLAPGRLQQLNIAVAPPISAQSNSAGSAMTLANNPLLAVGVFIGSAFALGWGINELQDDDPVAPPLILPPAREVPASPAVP